MGCKPSKCSKKDCEADHCPEQNQSEPGLAVDKCATRLEPGNFVLQGNQVDQAGAGHYPAVVKITLRQDHTVSGTHLDGGVILRGHWQSKAHDSTLSYQVEYEYGLYQYEGAVSAKDAESGQLVIVGKWHALSIHPALQNNRNYPALQSPHQRGTFKFTAESGDLVSALTLAATTGDVGKVSDLVLRQKVDVNAKNSAGTCALIEAAKAGQLGVVQFLLAIKGLQLHIKDRLGNTALCWAVRHQHLEVSQLLAQLMFPEKFHAQMSRASQGPPSADFFFKSAQAARFDPYMYSIY